MVSSDTTAPYCLQMPTNDLSGPRISCVVPCLNAEQHLRSALDALLATASPEDEIIAVYDESWDRTREILSRYAPRVQTIDRAASEPRGAAAAINCGFAASTGGILCWLGADDYVFPWAFRVVREAFVQHPKVEWITSTQPCVIKGDSVTAGRLKGLSKGYFLDGFTVPGVRRGAGWVQQESTFWRRSLWDKVGAQLNESLKIAFDFDLWSRFFQTADVCGVECLLGAFRYREGQLSADTQTISMECGAILQQARERCAWKADWRRESLLFMSRYKCAPAAKIGLATNCYSWNVLRHCGEGWQSRRLGFWP